MAEFLKSRPLPGNLREAIEYALLGAGKRLRPILVVRCCEAVGGAANLALAPAGAIEMMHCFSLVHDDLPAMDDDDLRRGRPTLHKHTSESMAILAGDGLLGLACELVATRLCDPNLCSSVIRELVVGTNDMIAGQVYDTLPDFDDQIKPMQRLETIHRHKTAALFRAACRMGAICGGASAQQLNAVTLYAEAIGLMFQIMDDLLDVTSTTKQLGKTAGKDEQQDKLTYPALLGIETSRDEVERLRQEALHALEPLGDQAGPLAELAIFMAARDK
jgi:geranylgeranyl diphosphate synthase type II